MKGLWLHRQVAAAGPHLALALNDSDVQQINRRLGVNGTFNFARREGGACTWTYEQNSIGKLACVVCLSTEVQQASLVELAVTVAHEAVHVWQAHAAWLGEREPGHEQEAYAVEWITRVLLEALDRRTGRFSGPSKPAT